MGFVDLKLEKHLKIHKASGGKIESWGKAVGYALVGLVAWLVFSAMLIVGGEMLSSA